MNLTRRKLSLALLALPAGCAFRPLPELRGEPAAPPPQPALWRPPALGQRWTYRKYNGFNSALLATQVDEVTRLEPYVLIRRRSDAGPAEQEEHQQPWGQVLRDVSWDYLQTYEQPVPLWPADPGPGARSVFQTHYRIDGFSYRYWTTHHITVGGWEHITVPAGRFLALRVDHYIRVEHHDFKRSETIRHDRQWLVPEIGRWAAREVSGEYLIPDGNGSYRGLEENHRWELASWT